MQKKGYVNQIILSLIFFIVIFIGWVSTNMTIVMVAPVLNFTPPTPDNNTIQSKDYTDINISINESNLDTFKFYWNGDLNATCDATTCDYGKIRGSSPNYWFSINKTNLVDGTYTYYGWAKDSAGDSNSTETRKLTIDTTAPVLNFTPPTPDNNTIQSKNYTDINISINDSNLDTFKFYWNGDLNATCDATTCDYGMIHGSSPNYWFSINKTNLTDGTYTYYGWAKDLVGDSNSTETRKLTIDTTNPEITINSPSSNTILNTKTIDLNLTATDADLNYTKISIKDSSGLKVNSTTNSTNGAYTITLSVPSDGNYNITATAYDKAGNSNTTTVTNITIDTTAPISHPVIKKDKFDVNQNYSCAGQSLTVKVTNSDNDRKVSDARVLLFYRAGEYYSLIGDKDTDSNGKAEFDITSEGDYKIQVTKDRYKSYTETFDVNCTPDCLEDNDCPNDESIDHKFDINNRAIVYILPYEKCSDYWTKTYGDIIYYYVYGNLSQDRPSIEKDFKIISTKYNKVIVVIPAEDTSLYFKNLMVVNNVAEKFGLEVLYAIFPNEKYGREDTYLKKGSKMYNLVVQDMQYLASMNATYKIAVWYGWTYRCNAQDIANFYQSLPSRLKDKYAVWLDEEYSKRVKDVYILGLPSDVLVITEAYDKGKVKSYSHLYHNQMLVTGYEGAKSLQEWRENIENLLSVCKTSNVGIWMFYDLGDGIGEEYAAFIDGNLADFNFSFNVS